MGIVGDDEKLDCVHHVQMVVHNEFLAKQDMANPNSSEIHSLSNPASQIIKMVSGSTQESVPAWRTFAFSQKQ
ncbi:hypothetical protein SRHO_G00086630 [Serrasalmus rhombeus]